MGVENGEVLPGEAVLIPIAAGMSAPVELLLAGADLMPNFFRRAAAEFPVLTAAVDTPVNSRFAPTDWPPIVATSPTASVAEIPLGGVIVVEKDPLASVVPSLTLRVPWLAVIVIGSPAIGFPDESRATTKALHGPAGSVVVVGTASIAREPTDRT